MDGPVPTRMRYAITGGCGFIGANLVWRLRPRAAAIRVLDNLSVGRREDLRGADVEFVEGDVRDAEMLRRVFDGVDCVVHLAAHTRVVESVEDPRANFDANVRGTFEVLAACRAAAVDTVVFASTGGAIMGEREPPVHEEMVPHPVSPYGASKLCGEAYCSAFAGAYGLRTVSLRFSNIYGPGSGRKGSAIAEFLRTILDGRPVTIYGDGEQTRDFLYVDDLCDGIARACEYRGPGGEVFHLASGQECSVVELLALIEKAVHPHPVTVRHAAERPGEVRRNFASIDKATAVLGFRPVVDLAEGLRRTWQWFQRPASATTATIATERGRRA